MNRQLVFVLSDMRSGSTLLDQLLGAHPSIMSLGELHWLPVYVRQDRSIYDPDHDLVCTCSQSVAACPFWSDVARRLGKPMESLRLRSEFPGIARRLLNRNPAPFRLHQIQSLLGQSRLVRDSLALFDAIFSACGRDALVDSSKSTFRFRSIHDAKPEQTRALVLARDYRAVAHSKMKRGHSLREAVRGWRRKMEQIEILTADLPARHVHKLSYESLCLQPESELTRICDFLGVDYRPAMLERPTANMHHIGGSPSKFDPLRVTIRMDESYRQAFSAAQCDQMVALVGNVGARWGY